MRKEQTEIKKTLLTFLNTIVEKDQYFNCGYVVENSDRNLYGLVKKKLTHNSVQLVFQSLKYNTHMVARVDDTSDKKIITLDFNLIYKIELFENEEESGYWIHHPRGRVFLGKYES